MKTALFSTGPVRRILIVAISAAFAASARAAVPPQISDTVPNFTLNTLDGKPVELRQLTARRTVVLLVLRGWPGYQCPICARQVHDFVDKAADFAARGVQVLMVYPGPADQLEAHAQEFLANKQWPAEYLFVIDPDYAFTNAYGLRWDAKNETAYPSTFIIDRGGKVRFAHISRSHGDRVSAQEAIEALQRLEQASPVSRR